MVEYLILLELSRKNRQGYQYNHYYSRDYDYESSNNYDDSINHSSETSNNNEVTNHKSHLKVKKTYINTANYCFNCYTQIPKGSEYCPYCGSINIRTTKNATPSTNYKSHLKVKKTSNKCLDYCYNCYTYIPKGKEYCPNCGSINIQRK